MKDLGNRVNKYYSSLLQETSTGKSSKTHMFDNPRSLRNYSEAEEGVKGEMYWTGHSEVLGVNCELSVQTQACGR